MRVLIIANYSKAGGGISVQVGMLQKKLQDEGYTCEIISTKGNAWKRLKSILHLLSVGRKYDVFHIHACSGKGFFPAVVGVSAGRLLRRRTVLTYHGGGAEGFFRKKKHLVRHFLTRTDQNIVLSGFIGEVFDRYQIPYTIIPNIIELKKNIYRERDTIRPEFISTRALTETYNVGCTIRAFQTVLQKYPEAELTLVGDGNKRKELEDYVREHGIPHVTFTGQVDNDTIYDYLNSADIIISSSRFDNMPVSVLEGFNAGLLVIASRVGGVPFMIKDGENGLLFHDNCDEELAEKMIYAVEHSNESAAMMKSAFHSLRQYRWENNRDSLLTIYKGN